MDLARLFGMGTVVLAVAVSLPQFLRLYRGATGAGVSLAAALNSAISFAAWTGYALRIEDGWLIASSAVGVPFAAATAWAAWRYRADRTGLWVPVCWACAIVAAAGCELLGLRGVLAATVGTSIAWLVVPAVLTAWRSADIAGISPGAWLMLATEGSLLLGYGCAAGVAAPVVYGVVALSGSGAVLARLPLGDRTRVVVPVTVPVAV